MSDRIIRGTFTDFPWVTLQVRGARGVHSLDFLIDTGFDGELAIPQRYMTLFGTPTGYRHALFANGHRETRGVTDCVVGWLDGDRGVKAMYLECENPLIGVEMLDGCHLDVTFEHGGLVEID